MESKNLLRITRSLLNHTEITEFEDKICWVGYYDRQYDCYQIDYNVFNALWRSDMIIEDCGNADTGEVNYVVNIPNETENMMVNLNNLIEKYEGEVKEFYCIDTYYDLLDVFKMIKTQEERKIKLKKIENNKYEK